MNGIRHVDVSASIAQDDLLEIGVDKFGQKQVLLGILPISGNTLEFVQIDNEEWGTRITNVPDFGDPTATGGGGFWIPPLFQVIEPNAQTTVKARQAAVGAETERCILKFMLADKNGGFPEYISNHIGELHTQFAEGIATNGNFPDRSSPTASQSVLNGVTDDMWMPLMGAAIGDTPGQVKFAHPQDDGYPPEVMAVSAVAQGRAMFQNIAPTYPLHGSDVMTYLAQDDAAAAVQMWLYMGRVAGGMKAMSSYTTIAV